MDCSCLLLLVAVVMAMLVPGLVTPLVPIGRDLDPSFNVLATQSHTYRPTQPLPSARLLKGEVLAPQQHPGPSTGPTRKSTSHQFTHNNTEFTTTPLQGAKGSQDGHKARALQYSNTSVMLPSQHHTYNNSTTLTSWALNVAPSF